MKDFSRLSVASMCAICISIRPFKYTQTDGNLLLLDPASPCVVESLDRVEFDNATCTVSLSQTKRWSQVQIYCRFKHNCQSLARGAGHCHQTTIFQNSTAKPKRRSKLFKKIYNSHRLGIAGQGGGGKVLIHFPVKNCN